MYLASWRCVPTRSFRHIARCADCASSTANPAAQEEALHHVGDRTARMRPHRQRDFVSYGASGFARLQPLLVVVRWLDPSRTRARNACSSRLRTTHDPRPMPLTTSSTEQCPAPSPISRNPPLRTRKRSVNHIADGRCMDWRATDPIADDRLQLVDPPNRMVLLAGAQVSHLHQSRSVLTSMPPGRS